MAVEREAHAVDRENDRAIDELARAVASGTTLALLGAGASVPAGYPTWKGLLARMAAIAGKRDRLGPKYVQKLANLPDPLWQADEYRLRMGEAEYLRFVARTFRPKPGALGKGLETLAALPFRHVITTNYDDALERAYAARGPRSRTTAFDWTDDAAVGEFLARLSDPQFERRCVHLHGDYRTPGRAVLTERDYVARYVAQADTRRKLYAIFATHRIVFVGFSLTDPELMPLLREVRASLGQVGARHFAVMATKGDSVDRRITRDHFEKKFGVRPVFYPETDDHRYLVRLLESVRESVEARTRPGAAAKRRARRAAPARGRRRTDEMFEEFREARGEGDEEDTRKGLFGGRPEANGRRLAATVKPIRGSRDRYSVRLTVESTEKSRPLSGTVEFHLHETFPESEVRRRVTKGVATLEFPAYGAFTAGAVADGGATRLELDLATVRGAPHGFREA